MCAWCPAVSPGIGPPYNLTYAHTHPTDRPPFTGTQTRLVVGHQAVHDRSSPAPDRDNRRDLRPPSRRHGSVVSPSTECSSTMAAMGPGASGVAKTCPLAGTHHSTRSGGRETLCCGQGIVSSGMQSVGHVTQAPSQTARGKAEGSWGKVAGPLQSVAPTMPVCNLPANMDIPYSFRSPESVEMDEIMAAMVLTSLSCSPVVQSPPQTHHGPAVSSSSADMECGGEELSDSGSSGYWSWDHGNVSPAPSPSVTEMDSSPDEGLQLELEQGEEFNTRKAKSSIRGMYKCLWPGCGKVLAASVGMKRHIRLLHLGSVSDQSQREEDFYYTKIPCEAVDTPPPLQAAIQAPTSTHIGWASCSSPSSSEIQVLPAPRPRSNSSSGPGPGRPSTLSQSAPSSFWQIHSEHLYQACSPLQLATASPPSRSPASQGWVPFVSVSAHDNSPVVKPRFRSVSVGEQWLQQNSAANRLQTMSASPSRSLCSFRKGRGEAKKCRKVYGVERKDQWCTACRWKKACQRFPD